MNIYKWLYMHTPFKRPFTYVARDLYHKFEYIWLVGLFLGGFIIGKSGLVNWKWLVVIMATYTIGYIHGHFFWGTKYIENQPGEDGKITIIPFRVKR